MDSEINEDDLIGMYLKDAKQQFPNEGIYAVIIDGELTTSMPTNEGIGVEVQNDIITGVFD